MSIGKKDHGSGSKGEDRTYYSEKSAHKESLQMKRILLTSWIADTLFARLPFLERKAPWYRRYRLNASPWLPVALVAPLATFLLIEGLRRRFLSRSTESDQAQEHPNP
jgi:hypothetical protein